MNEGDRSPRTWCQCAIKTSRSCFALWQPKGKDWGKKTITCFLSPPAAYRHFAAGWAANLQHRGRDEEEQRGEILCAGFRAPCVHPQRDVPRGLRSHTMLRRVLGPKGVRSLSARAASTR